MLNGGNGISSTFFSSYLTPDHNPKFSWFSSRCYLLCSEVVRMSFGKRGFLRTISEEDPKKTRRMAEKYPCFYRGLYGEREGEIFLLDNGK